MGAGVTDLFDDGRSDGVPPVSADGGDPDSGGGGGGGGYIEVTCGAYHACALRAADRRAACWGGDADGQARPPPGLALAAVSAGARHTCGIAAGGAGRPVCWGANAGVGEREEELVWQVRPARRPASPPAAPPPARARAPPPAGGS
jgi:hypothetical protein